VSSPGQLGQPGVERLDAECGAARLGGHPYAALQEPLGRVRVGERTREDPVQPLLRSGRARDALWYVDHQVRRDRRELLRAGQPRPQGRDEGGVPGQRGALGVGHDLELRPALLRRDQRQALRDVRR
jgi:hypothetical protein